MNSPLLLILQCYLLLFSSYISAQVDIDADDDMWAMFRGMDHHFDYIEEQERKKNDPNLINCSMEVKEGKCWKEFTKMQANCKDECAVWQKEQEKRDTFPIDDENESFYDLSATSFTGKKINFERFEGYVTIIVNTAKVCKGDLEEIEKYLSSIEQIRNISPITNEVVVFPFDYSEMEYGTMECYLFEQAAAKPDRPIHIMEPTEINGPETHPVYQFLKKTAGIEDMNTDIPTYFVVSSEGDKLEVHQTTMMGAFKNYMRARLKKDYNELKIDCHKLVKEEKCWTNPAFMQEHCEEECSNWKRYHEKHDTFPIDETTNGSFYDLSANSTTGEKTIFDEFKGKVTIIYNTPKYCKTERKEVEDYLKSIEEINDVTKDAIEVLVFPFAQPNVEYKKDACYVFDKAAKDPERTIRFMELSEINGPETHPVYQFLKKTAGIDELNNIRPTFFVVSAKGDKLEVHEGKQLGSFKTFMKARYENERDEL